MNNQSLVASIEMVDNANLIERLSGVEYTDVEYDDTSSDEELANNIRVLRESDNLMLERMEMDYGSDDDESADCYDTPFEDCDGELIMHRKSKNKAIATVDVSSNFKVEWKVGMKFSSPEVFKETVNRYAVTCGYRITWSRSENMKKLEAKCKSGCTWKIYASWDGPREAFVVKTLNSSHTCNRADYENSQAKPKWLAKEFLMEFKSNPNLTCKYLAQKAMEKFGVAMDKYKFNKVKIAAHKLLYGSLEDHYMKVGSYIGELQIVDPHTSVLLLTEENDTTYGPPVFKRLYISFQGLREGFLKGCRPIICLDGCFLKTFLGGMLLCAIGRDGNNQMFPVAWAVVEAENNDSWNWFLEYLKKDLSSFGGEECTIISDQQKGLVNAVRLHFPLAEHRNCARHIFANWHKNHKGEQLKYTFWKAAKAYTASDYNAALEEMGTLSSKAVEDFLSQNPQTFCRSKLRTLCKSDVHVNNLAETFNGYILNARTLPLIDMMEQIRLSLLDRMFQKRLLMEKSNDTICPRIRKQLEKNKVLARQCIVHRAQPNEFQVMHQVDMLHVSLEKKSCTCRVWDLTGVPCCHAIACYNSRKVPCENHVADWFGKEKYASAYFGGITPVTGEKHWKKVHYPLAPPRLKARAGRPRKNRKKDPHERYERPGKLSKHGVQMTCKACGGKDHNIRTCTQRGSTTTSSNVEHSVRKRGRPRKMTTEAASNDQYRRARPRGRPRKGSNPNLAIVNERVPREMGAYFSETSQRIFINPGLAGATVISQSQEGPGPSQP